MAGIDKIYGTREQHDELSQWLSENLPEGLQYLYHRSNIIDGGSGCISNFPEHIDKQLLKICTIAWVIDRIKFQYNIKDKKRKHGKRDR